MSSYFFGFNYRGFFSGICVKILVYLVRLVVGLVTRSD